MGLDVGIMTVRYLERPRGTVYEFAWELAHEASVNGYLHGDGNNWGPFTQRQVLHMLDDFAEKRGLDPTAKAEVLAWVKSLPWDGWEDNLAPGEPSHDHDFHPVLDNDPKQHGGLIELHFNW